MGWGRLPDKSLKLSGSVPDGFLEAVDSLKATNLPDAKVMAENISSAIMAGSIPFEVIQELSKWCNTDGPFARGRVPAEKVSLTLFGRSLPRLAGQNANVPVDPVEAAKLYDEFCQMTGIS